MDLCVCPKLLEVGRGVKDKINSLLYSKPAELQKVVFYFKICREFQTQAGGTIISKTKPANYSNKQNLGGSNHIHRWWVVLCRKSWVQRQDIPTVSRPGSPRAHNTQCNVCTVLTPWCPQSIQSIVSTLS